MAICLWKRYLPVLLHFPCFWYCRIGGVLTSQIHAEDEKLGCGQFFLCLVLILEVLLQVYNLFFLMDNWNEIKFGISSIGYHWSVTWHRYARPSKRIRVWQRTAPAFSVLWVISVSVSLLCVAQCSSVVESSCFLLFSQNLDISLGTGRTSTYTDHRRWRAVDMWQSLRLWLRYQVTASGKPRLPHSRLAASMRN